MRGYAAWAVRRVLALAALGINQAVGGHYFPPPEAQGVDTRALDDAVAWLKANRGCDGQRRTWPHARPRTSAASGFNNNLCFVVPEWCTVVVRLGLDGNVEDKVGDAFFAKLSAAIAAAREENK